MSNEPALCEHTLVWFRGEFKPDVLPRATGLDGFFADDRRIFCLALTRRPPDSWWFQPWGVPSSGEDAFKRTPHSRGPIIFLGFRCA